jgi:hypothetical protein
MSDLTEILLWAFRQNFHLDHSNACVHTAHVRYSPLTFRLAEKIQEQGVPIDAEHFSDVYMVLLDRGAYLEDAGR